MDFYVRMSCLNEYPYASLFFLKGQIIRTEKLSLICAVWTDILFVYESHTYKFFFFNLKLVKWNWSSFVFFFLFVLMFNLALFSSSCACVLLFDSLEQCMTRGNLAESYWLAVQIGVYCIHFASPIGVRNRPGSSYPLLAKCKHLILLKRSVWSKSIRIPYMQIESWRTGHFICPVESTCEELMPNCCWF